MVANSSPYKLNPEKVLVPYRSMERSMYPIQLQALLNLGDCQIWLRANSKSNST